ncbi:MAG: ABC transporter permease, partial [Planctomycetales bacterium]|nr:ABC transporter permease [Planctomycetales bacterium]
MFVGPVFSRELITAPRRPKLFLYRSVYASVLFGVMCTAWLVMTGTQTIRNIDDMARFGLTLFQILGPLQLAIVAFIAALSTASAVAQEKDRKTLILLLLTRLNNSELVLGKLFSSLLQVLVMLLAGLPVFAFLVLFGGISFPQVFRVFLVTLLTALAAGSFGSTVALWREKTFQTLAITALGLVFWLLACEAIAANAFGPAPYGIHALELATSLSPMRAVIEASEPMSTTFLGSPTTQVFLLVTAAFTCAVNVLAIWRVRIWNPSREVRAGQNAADAAFEDSWNMADVSTESTRRADEARAQHVDSHLNVSQKQPYRQVWDNPVLWREACTWAYGKKIIFIKLAYLLFAASISLGIAWTIQEQASVSSAASGFGLPQIAKPVLPLFIVSLVMVNALAVTTITTERDG